MYYPRLRDLREDRDLTQKEVAAVLGIDQRVYSTYETGRREIPAHHAVALSFRQNRSKQALSEEMSLCRSACGGIFCPHTSLTACFFIRPVFYILTCFRLKCNNLFQIMRYYAR